MNQHIILILEVQVPIFLNEDQEENKIAIHELQKSESTKRGDEFGFGRKFEDWKLSRG